MWKTAFKKFEADHVPSNFLKAVFHKFYLVHSWIFCPFCGSISRSNISSIKYTFVTHLIFWILNLISKGMPISGYSQESVQFLGLTTWEETIFLTFLFLTESHCLDHFNLGRLSIPEVLHSVLSHFVSSLLSMKSEQLRDTEWHSLELIKKLYWIHGKTHQVKLLLSFPTNIFITATVSSSIWLAVIETFWAQKIIQEKLTKFPPDFKLIYVSKNWFYSFFLIFWNAPIPPSCWMLCYRH